jgi:hypothetical protein
VVEAHGSTIDSLALTMTTKEAPTCAHPDCTNEPVSGAKYCGLPDPVTGQPHTAMTSFRRRQELAAQSGAAGPEDPGSSFWHPRRHRGADEQRRQQAEAAEEARSAVLEAEARAAAAEALAAAAATRAAAAEAHALAAEQEAARARQELGEVRKAGGLWLAREGSMLGELVKGVYEAVDWLIDPHNDPEK